MRFYNRMANFVKVNEKALHVESDIIFEGALLSDTRAVLVTELIHYILYERQQIPLPPDQLKRRVQFSQGTEAAFQSQSRPVQNATDRKSKQFLDDLLQICDNLKKSFRSCPEIDQVAIFLGGTIVSPKESYLIKFPPTCPDADCVPLKLCKTKLFKQIIGEDVLGSLKTLLSPSNIMVMLSAPRSCPLDWFLPKHSISSPKTGTVVSFNLQCLYLGPICHDLSITDCDTSDMSGLEALECTLCDFETNETPGEISDDDQCRSHEDGDGKFNIANWDQRQFCGEPRLSNCRTVKTSAVGNRFCEHKKLNYIFSARKKGKIPVIHSPAGFHAFSLACHKSSSPQIERCEESSIYHPCSLTDKSMAHPTALVGTNFPSDYIWYQSPIVLKGFKDQVDIKQKSKFLF